MGEGQAMDVVQWAAQLGRLDWISALLAGLAIILALGIFPFYLTVRQHAAKVAREEAKQAAELALENVERAAIQKLEELLPELVQQYMDLAKSALSPEVADKIAQAQGNDDAPANGS